jgi:hypothetical protein
MFLVPFEKNRQFIGREATLSQLEKQLHARYRVSIYGPGGIGYVLLLNGKGSLAYSQELPGNHKSLLNTLTDSITPSLRAMSSGWMQVILLGFGSRTRRFLESSTPRE